jgi:hypothetical protein
MMPQQRSGMVLYQASRTSIHTLMDRTWVVVEVSILTQSHART